MWFVKLKGVGDDTHIEELKKWIKKDNVIKVIPYIRRNDAKIISDVWIGNIFINRQFKNYNKNKIT